MIAILNDYIVLKFDSIFNKYGVVNFNFENTKKYR